MVLEGEQRGARFHPQGEDQVLREELVPEALLDPVHVVRRVVAGPQVLAGLGVLEVLEAPCALQQQQQERGAWGWSG